MAGNADVNARRYCYDDIVEFKDYLFSKSDIRPKIGIICGTGLGGLADSLEDRFTISYVDIPNFPVSTVKGHAGRFVMGKLKGKSVICMQGRFHLYEGNTAQMIGAPVQVMHMMGVHTLFVTNAAGGINRSYNVGDVMIIKDHINFAGMAGNNPLVGLNEDRFGPRFPNMSDAYDSQLRKLAHTIATELEYDSFIREGVYAMICGPSFETPAEIRFLQAGGADAVGMSTCPEVVAARHCGIRVLGISFISNMSIMETDTGEVLTEEQIDTYHAGIQEQSMKKLQNLVSIIVERM